MDLSAFTEIEAEVMIAHAETLIQVLDLARVVVRARWRGSEVAAAILDLAILFPPLSVVGFEGMTGLVIGYVPGGTNPSLSLVIPGVGRVLAPASESALIATWGGLTAANIAVAVEAGVTPVILAPPPGNPYTRVTIIEA